MIIQNRVIYYGTHGSFNQICITNYLLDFQVFFFNVFILMINQKAKLVQGLTSVQTIGYVIK